MPPTRRPTPPTAFTWVFLVPALNEEVTIRDSVDRLLSLDLERRLVVVINDGSDDGTGEVLAGIRHPDLMVVERTLPEARKGKAAALNQAYREVSQRIGHHDRARVIVVIVDADGRLHHDAPRYVAGHFEDERVGGVQALVQIYNRNEILDLVPERRVLDLRPPLPGRPQRLGHRQHGRKRPVQPAQRTG